jgi:hypothetical protein
MAATVYETNGMNLQRLPFIIDDLTLAVIDVISNQSWKLPFCFLPAATRARTRTGGPQMQERAARKRQR